MCLCLFQVYNGILYMLYPIWAFQQSWQFYHHFIGGKTGSKVPAYSTYWVWLRLSTPSPLETQAVITGKANQDSLDGPLEDRL